MVAANLDDEESLERAFDGATAIFAFTDYYDYSFKLGAEESIVMEFEQGMRIARTANKSRLLERLILSCGPQTSLITKGEAIYPHLEGKGRIVTHITNEMPNLAKKTTFTVFTVFASNAQQYDIFKPIYVATDSQEYITMYPVPADTPYPPIGDPATNCGIFVRSFIETPPPLGSLIRCNVEALTVGSFLALLGHVSGIATIEGSTAAVQVTPESYVQLWGHMAAEQASQWKFFAWLQEHDRAEWEGITVLEGIDLSSENDRKSLLSVKDSLWLYDWSGIERRPVAVSVNTRFVDV